LHGLEEYPETLVLSETDYLDFLVRVSQDRDSRDPVIPLYLQQALVESSLVLLGYRLNDWDFKALFRGIINNLNYSPGQRKLGLMVTLAPHDAGESTYVEEAQNYLQAYFKESNFSIWWGSVESFAQQLWDRWVQWRD
jgi:hypothetical protein